MPRPTTPTLSPFTDQLPDVNSPATWATRTPLFWNWVTGPGYDSFTNLLSYSESAVDFIDAALIGSETVVDAVAALQDDNSGPAAPSSPTPGARWRDTSVSPAVLRVRNDANTAWVEFLAAQGMTATGLAVARAATALAARTAIGSPTITISTATPSGGQNGDLWFQY